MFHEIFHLYFDTASHATIANALKLGNKKFKEKDDADDAEASATLTQWLLKGCK